MIIRERPTPSKLSTRELKQALQKIKQTQIQVLKVLKHEGQNSNQHDLNVKAISQNIDQNLPYIRSINHINLLKMSQIENIRKQSQRQKQKNMQNMQRLMSKIKYLQNQLKAKSQSQLSPSKSYQKISSTHKISEQNKNKQAASKIQTMNIRMSSYEKQIQEKNRQIDKMKIRQQELQKRKNEILKQKQHYKYKFQEAFQEKQFQKLIKENKNQIPLSFFSDIKVQIKKMGQIHDKMYQNFKQKARLYRIDLQMQQSFKQSLSNAIKTIQHYQTKGNEDKASIDDESIIKNIKFLNKQQNEHTNINNNSQNDDFIDIIKKQNLTLQHDNIKLKQDLQTSQRQLLQLKLSYQDEIQNILKQHQQKMIKSNNKQIQDNKHQDYNILIKQIQKQMLKIRQQKILLTNMFKKISQHAIKAQSDQDITIIKQNLLNVLQINDKLRKQNQIKFRQNNVIKIQLQKIKYQKNKLQQKVVEINHFIDKQANKFRFFIQQKGKLEQQLREKHVIIVKKQQKIKQLGLIIDGNIMKYQNDIRIKNNEINMLKMQIQKNIKQLRLLRETAFNYQIITKENDFLKNKIYQINSNVIHLWEVKETQYQNIFKILQFNKQNQ